MHSNTSHFRTRRGNGCSRRKKYRPLGHFREQNIRGPQAEAWFFRVLDAQLHFPDWLLRVERSTFEQDMYKETDAVVHCTDGMRIPIQIKTNARETRGSCPKNGIVFVCRRGDNELELLLDLLLRIWYFRTYCQSLDYEVHL